MTILKIIFAWIILPFFLVAITLVAIGKWPMTWREYVGSIVNWLTGNYTYRDGPFDFSWMNKQEGE